MCVCAESVWSLSTPTCTRHAAPCVRVWGRGGAPRVQRMLLLLIFAGRFPRGGAAARDFMCLFLRRAAAGGARAGPDADRDDTTHHISPRYVHLRAHIRYVSISSRSSCRAPVHRRLTRRMTRVVCCALWFFCVWVHSALQSIPIGFELIGDHDRRRQAD